MSERGGFWVAACGLCAVSCGPWVGDRAGTAAWATWLLGHILLALKLKQERVPLLARGLFSNPFGAGWLVGMIALVLAMTSIPAVRDVLGTTPLTGGQWVMVVARATLASA